MSYQDTALMPGGNSFFDPGGFYAPNKTPPMPDFMGLAQQQSYANRVNTNTPWGSQQYSTRSVIDPSTGKPVTVWDSNISLDPRLQGALNAQMGTQQNLSQLAQGMSGGVADALSQPFSYGGIAAAPDYRTAMNDAISANYNQATSRLDPQWDTREEQARTRLMNQGLDPGSEAYTAAMGDLGRQRNDAYSSAMANAITQGNQTAQTQFGIGMQGRQQALSEYERQRAQPLNELQALLAGQQVGMPTFPDTAAAGSYQGAGQQQYQALMNAWNANQAQNQAKQQGMLSLGAGLFSMFSDERMKEDIERLPVEALPGVPFASWRWKGTGRIGIGVIAQDLEKVRPDLVNRDPDTGMLKVDYSFLEVAHG